MRHCNRPQHSGAASLSTSNTGDDGHPQRGLASALDNHSPSGRQRATLSPIKSNTSGRTAQLSRAMQGRASPDVCDDTARSMSSSEYERGKQPHQLSLVQRLQGHQCCDVCARTAFGIDPWSEHSGSIDDGPADNINAISSFADDQGQRQILSPRPVTADSFLREETPKRLQDGPQWTRAADFVLDETIAHSLKHSLTTSTPATATAEDVRCGRRPKSVDDLDDGRTTQLGRDTCTVAPRPNTVCWEQTLPRGTSFSSDRISKHSANAVMRRTSSSRRRRKQRPVRGLTRWQHGQSKGRSAVVGAGRSVVYDTSV